MSTTKTKEEIALDTIIERVSELIHSINPELILTTFSRDNKYKTQRIINKNTSKPIGVFKPQNTESALTFNYKSFNNYDEHTRTQLLSLIPVITRICVLAREYARKG